MRTGIAECALVAGAAGAGKAVDSIRAGSDNTRGAGTLVDFCAAEMRASSAGMVRYAWHP